MSDTDIITLKPATNGTFQVEFGVIKHSKTLKDLVEDAGLDQVVPIPNVEFDTMVKVIEFLKGLQDQAYDKDNFCNDMKLDMIFDLIRVSNYLDIPDLLDVTTTSVAKQIKGKTVEQICEIFNIKNDCTEEEIEAAKKENEWASER